MDFEEFKKDFKHGKYGLQTVVKGSDRGIVAILTDLNKLKDCLQDELDADVIMDNFELSDYSHKADVYVTVDYNGEIYNDRFELDAVSVY